MHALSDDQQVRRLEKKVDDGFNEMRAEFKAVREEMVTEFKAVREEMATEFKAVREEMGAEFRAVRAEGRADFRTLVAINLTMVTAMIFGFAGIVIAMLTHG